MGVLVCGFFVETLYFLFSVHTCLFLTASTTRGTTQLTLVTAHHDRIPSQPYGDFLIFVGVFLIVMGLGDLTWTPTSM